MASTAAHDQTQTIHIVVSYPEHGARAEDPHYADFQAAKKRLKDAGLYKCVVCGTDQHIELHHDKVEFSLMNAVDLPKLNEAYGLHLTDEDFGAWIDGPGNLEPLCMQHHRGTEGIHVTPTPLWGLLRLEKAAFFIAKGNI